MAGQNTRSVKKYVAIGAIGVAVLVGVLAFLSYTRAPPQEQELGQGSSNTAAMPGSNPDGGGGATGQQQETADLPNTTPGLGRDEVNSPYISMSPNPYTASSGGPATVIGSGFTPGEEVTIMFDGAPVETEPAAVVSDSSGTFTVQAAIPESQVGDHVMTAEDASGKATSISIIVE